MIEINLVPEEIKARLKLEEKNAELKKYLFVIPLFLGALAMVHLYLAVMLFINTTTLKNFERRWRELEPQKKNLEGFQAEYAMLSGDSQIIQQLTNQRVIWARICNVVSAALPQGIWLTEMSFSEKNVALKGIAFSLAKDEVSLINKFLNALKSDELFIKNFKILEMGTMQVRALGTREVTDFVFSGVLN